MVQLRKHGNNNLIALVDKIMEQKDARNKAKTVCTFTKPNSAIRRELLKSLGATRKVACRNKRGDNHVCGYNRMIKGKEKTIKPYCRKKATKKKK